MANFAQQAAEMLESDANFRAQFDRDHPDFHGDIKQAVDTGGARIPEGMEAHKNWKALAVRDDGNKENESIDLGSEYGKISKLRDQLGELKKAVQALCLPTDMLCKARTKVSTVEVPAAAANTAAEIEAASSAPDFIAAEAFDGAKPGMAFANGPQGNGYYNQAKTLAQAQAGAARAAKAAGRKRAQAAKGVATAEKRLAVVVDTLRSKCKCVEDSEFSKVGALVESLIADATSDTLTEKTYKEVWSIALKRCTEKVFHCYMGLLDRLKAIKRAQGVGVVPLVVPEALVGRAEPESELSEGEKILQKERVLWAAAEAEAVAAVAAAAAEPVLAEESEPEPEK